MEHLEISDLMRRNHQKLSQASVDFLEFASRQPGILKAANFPDIKAYIDGRIRLQIWPTFINGEILAQIKEAAVEVKRLIQSIPQRIFDNDPDRLAPYFHITREEALIYLMGCHESHLKYLIGRGDFILCEDGFKCAEYNMASNLGGANFYYWTPLYLEAPLIDSFLKEYHISLKENRPFALALIDMLFQAGMEFLNL